MTTIGNRAFYGCRSLTSIVIPNSITMIGKDAFYGCTSIPLCTATVRCLKWVDIQRIFLLNMSAIHDVDKKTGLPVFVLAAVGPTSHIEAVYNLLREFPPAIIGLMNDSHPNSSTGVVRKRGHENSSRKRATKSDKRS